MVLRCMPKYSLGGPHGTQGVRMCCHGCLMSSYSCPMVVGCVPMVLLCVPMVSYRGRMLSYDCVVWFSYVFRVWQQMYLRDQVSTYVFLYVRMYGACIFSYLCICFPIFQMCPTKLLQGALQQAFTGSAPPSFYRKHRKTMTHHREALGNM